MPNTYQIGDSVTLTASIAATSGGMVDPTSLFLQLRWPTGSVAAWGYPDFTKVATGHYTFNVNCLNLSGNYYYRWFSTGSGQAAEQAVFEVVDNVIEQ